MGLKIESITDYIKCYQENWRSHVNGMDAGRFPKAIFYDIDLRGKHQ
jgi:hypothetical protein